MIAEGEDMKPDVEEVEVIDSDDDEDDMEDFGLEYDETMETFPRFPAYDPGLKKVTGSLTGIVEDILKIIEANPCNSNHVKCFQSNGKKLLHIPKPKVIRIALLGDTGAGKCQQSPKSEVDC